MDLSESETRLVSITDSKTELSNREAYLKEEGKEEKEKEEEKKRRKRRRRMNGSWNQWKTDRNQGSTRRKETPLITLQTQEQARAVASASPNEAN